METTTSTIETKIITNCKFHIYKKVVYAILSKQTGSSKPFISHHLISRDHYNSHKHLKHFDWVIDKSKSNLQLITEEFLDLYTRGKGYDCDPNNMTEPIDKWLNILSKSEDRVVGLHFHYDGFLYDIKGNKLIKALCFSNYLSDIDLNVKIEVLVAHLNKQKGVFDIEIHNLSSHAPYESYEGSQTVYFYFMPTKQLFKKLFIDNNLTSYALMNKIYEKLKIHKFIKGKI